MWFKVKEMFDLKSKATLFNFINLGTLKTYTL